MVAVEQIAAEKGPALEVKAFRNLAAGVIVTGNEVFSGRIRDGFAPRVQEKLDQFGSDTGRLLYLPDGAAGIAAAHNTKGKLFAGGRDGSDSGRTSIWNPALNWCGWGPPGVCRSSLKRLARRRW